MTLLAGRILAMFGSQVSRDERGPTEARNFAVYLAVAALAGFFCGICFSTWKSVIEPSQVVAATVTYAPDNPNFMQQVKMYTIVHQALAVLLKLGFSEWTLSRFLSGLEGSLIFLSVGIPIFAISGRIVLAAFFPFLLVRAFGTTIEGVTYPVFLIDNPQNWGMIGLTFVVIVLGLFLVDRKSAASFGLGLAPAVHPSLGFWLLLSVGAVALRKSFRMRARLPVAVIPLGLGLAVSLLAGGFHFFFFPGYPVPLSIDGGSSDFQVEIKVWDMHRAPFDLMGGGIMLVLSAVAVSAIALLGRQRADDRIRFFSESLLATAVVAAVFSIGNWRPDVLPGWVMAMMPSRTFNIAILAFFGLWIGLLAARRRVAFGTTLAIVLVLLASGFFHVLLPPLALCVALALDSLLERRNVVAGLEDRNWWRRLIAGTQAVALIVAFGLVCVPRLSEVASPSQGIAAADPVARVLRMGSGLVLVGSDINFVQAWSRRPVLLRGESIDVYAYAPEAGPAVARILGRLYGIDYYSPPRELWKRGGLAPDSGRQLWESRSEAEWVALASEFDFTEIVTWKDWRLRLPLIETGAELSLYRIPRRR
jgi:hypothetical protein